MMVTKEKKKQYNRTYRDRLKQDKSPNEVVIVKANQLLLFGKPTTWLERYDKAISIRTERWDAYPTEEPFDTQYFDYLVPIYDFHRLESGSCVFKRNPQDKMFFVSIGMHFAEYSEEVIVKIKELNSLKDDATAIRQKINEVQSTIIKV